jgi:hypothetical protein
LGPERSANRWQPSFLAAGGVDLPAPIADVRADPVAAWTGHSAAVQALFAEGDRCFVHPYTEEHPLSEVLDKFYTADVFMHTWVLARAAGIEPDLDPGRCTELLHSMEPIEEVLRSSGEYGPPVEIDAAASPQNKLIAFINRDPHWTPPAARDRRGRLHPPSEPKPPTSSSSSCPHATNGPR